MDRLRPREVKQLAQGHTSPVSRRVKTRYSDPPTILHGTASPVGSLNTGPTYQQEAISLWYLGSPAQLCLAICVI